MYTTNHARLGGVLFLVAAGFWHLGAQGARPWKLDLRLGYDWDQEGQGRDELVVDTGFYHTLITTPRPEFFDLGGRIAMGSRGIRLGAGVRHKLWLSPWPTLDQEVVAGVHVPWTGRLIAGFSGSFGAWLPWEGGEWAYPSWATGIHLTWALGWEAESGRFDPSLGLRLGLGGNGGEAVR